MGWRAAAVGPGVVQPLIALPLAAVAVGAWTRGSLLACIRVALWCAIAAGVLIGLGGRSWAGYSAITRLLVRLLKPGRPVGVSVRVLGRDHWGLRRPCDSAVSDKIPHLKFSSSRQTVSQICHAFPESEGHRRTREETRARQVEYRRTRRETGRHQRTRHTAGSGP